MQAATLSAAAGAAATAATHEEHVVAVPAVGLHKANSTLVELSIVVHTIAAQPVWLAC